MNLHNLFAELKRRSALRENRRIALAKGAEQVNAAMDQHEGDAMKRECESTEDFKLRIAVIVRGKGEYVAGARRPNALLVRKPRTQKRGRR